ncbi:hypothetical protein Tco_0800670 [Tanacetum coccineum]|uniref:Uncharacterized protein n=1 Tax=Tanacetum coccineum TaxID=301880 RepID=A0ABQ4ZXV5_9ASTR
MVSSLLWRRSKGELRVGSSKSFLHGRIGLNFKANLNIWWFQRSDEEDGGSLNDQRASSHRKEEIIGSLHMKVHFLNGWIGDGRGKTRNHINIIQITFFPVAVVNTPKWSPAEYRFGSVTS